MKKQIVIKKLIKARKKILDLIRPLSKQLWEEVFLGTWSLKDLVAHLIGWDIWGLRATKEILQGKLPSYYQYYDEEIHTEQIRDWLKNQRTEDILDLAGKFRIKNKKSLLKARESMEKHYKRF